jgi:hypothetical protein
VKTALLFIAGIFILGIFLYVGMIIYWVETTEVEMLSKTHFDFFVKEGQIVDYKDFINPHDETSALDQIDKGIRLQIANYMRENNLKLKEGNHHIRKKVVSNPEEIGNFHEHMEYLNFENM